MQLVRSDCLRGTLALLALAVINFHPALASPATAEAVFSTASFHSAVQERGDSTCNGGLSFAMISADAEVEAPALLADAGVFESIRSKNGVSEPGLSTYRSCTSVPSKYYWCMENLVRNGGFFPITGDSGRGKSIVLPLLTTHWTGTALSVETDRTWNSPGASASDLDCAPARHIDAYYFGCGGSYHFI
jgi:hypothetical protein